jgi:hypothetical protein
VPGGGTRPIDTPRAENGDEESPHTQPKVPFKKGKVPKPPTRPPPTHLPPQPTQSQSTEKDDPTPTKKKDSKE